MYNYKSSTSIGLSYLRSTVEEETVTAVVLRHGRRSFLATTVHTPPKFHYTLPAVAGWSSWFVYVPTTISISARASPFSFIINFIFFLFVTTRC